MYEELLNIEIKCEDDLDKIEDKLNEYNITKYKIDCDIAYDSCGFNAYYYAVSYIYDDKLYLLTGTWEEY